MNKKKYIILYIIDSFVYRFRVWKGISNANGKTHINSKFSKL